MQMTYRSADSAGDQAVVDTPSKKSASAVGVFPGRPTQLNAWINALRLHHWSKNVLILMPLLLSHRFQQWRVLASLKSFFAFSCCASAFYVFNDLLDIEADRVHPYKATRPFASGRLNIRQGLILLATCLAASIALAWMLPLSARIVLILYALTNLSYSAGVKQIVFLDVLVLALLYTLRLLFGGAVEYIDVSFWTLAFSLFLFLGLASLKRWTELLSLTERQGARLARRGYMSSHLATVRFLSQCSLYLSVVVLAFYVNSEAASMLYRYPQMLWLVCLLLLVWIRRVTLITSRGLMAEDPVLFAFKDLGSQLIAVLVIVLGALAVGSR